MLPIESEPELLDKSHERPPMSGAAGSKSMVRDTHVGSMAIMATQENGSNFTRILPALSALVGEAQAKEDWETKKSLVPHHSSVF